MRKIVVIKLENNTNINVVADVKKPEEARNLAAKHFCRLIGDKNYEITKSSKIVSHEDWEQSRVSNIQDGNKLYKVAFYLNNVTQCVDVSAVSVKSAYNKVKIKFGIEENLFMIIYDTTQSVRKNSAIETSIKVLENSDSLYKVLKRTADKVKSIDELQKIKPGVGILLNMIRDGYTGKFNIDKNKLVSAVACLVYFNEPYTTTQDIFNNLEDTGDIGIMKMLLTAMKNDLYSYRNTCSKKRK